jgi:hypothetical protein
VGGSDKATIYDKYGQRIANSFEGVMVSQRSDAQCQANARLIAAAPDLLAACQALLDEFPGLDSRRIEAVKATCRAAIARATGKD